MLDSRPAGAEISVERWQGRAWVEHQAPVVAPFDVELPSGSYRFTLTIKGRPTVRYPVLLGRGETVKDTVVIPATVPDGFVYIPPARVLIGSTAEEGHRRDFQHAPPLHERRVGGFFIAKTELTYDDWIRWLETLPASEFERRTPRAATFGTQGYLHLERVGDRWHLTIMPSATERLEAFDGEPITYRARSKNKSVRWRLLPVTGVSLEDATAYARWLDNSGLLKGARLCSEEEWEAAARGADSRPYAIGDEVKPEDGNWQWTYGGDASSRGPDEVGSTDVSSTVYGLDGLVGNVMDMTSQMFEGLSASCRGGSFAYDLGAVRIEQRNQMEATYRDITVGVRLCSSLR
jgi:formylglycine-generating enzyme required for sulfatase activity